MIKGESVQLENVLSFVDLESAEKSISAVREKFKQELEVLYKDFQTEVDTYCSTLQKQPTTIINILDNFIPDQIGEIKSLLDDAQYVDLPSGDYGLKKAEQGCSQVEGLLVKLRQSLIQVIDRRS
ncbi:MAG: hypothetical protein AAB657_01560 [Patescibacteria group bacterium]